MRTRCRVMTTPQGTGAPMNLWPETLTEPMGFLKLTSGARLMKGICAGSARGSSFECAPCLIRRDEQNGSSHAPWTAGMQASERAALSNMLCCSTLRCAAALPCSALLGFASCSACAHHHAEERAVHMDVEALLAVPGRLQRSNHAIHIIRRALDRRADVHVHDGGPLAERAQLLPEVPVIHLPGGQGVDLRGRQQLLQPACVPDCSLRSFLHKPPRA